MKTIALAIAIGLAFSGVVLAEQSMKNVQQKEDILHGYGQASASAAQPAGVEESNMKNVQQQEDLIHGYGETTASKSQPAAVRVGKTNREQQEDQIHGYDK